jgi:hypothetical protein
VNIVGHEQLAVKQLTRIVNNTPTIQAVAL